MAPFNKIGVKTFTISNEGVPEGEKKTKFFKLAKEYFRFTAGSKHMANAVNLDTGKLEYVAPNTEVDLSVDV